MTYIPVALRRQVYERARGCCEYCLIPDLAAFSAHEIDHIIAEKHGGLTEAENLALSCTLCNKHNLRDNGDRLFYRNTIAQKYDKFNLISISRYFLYLAPWRN